MAKPDEISSTEKLLGVIRGENEKRPVSEAEVLPSAASKAGKPSVVKAFFSQKKITIGVDIGTTDLRLAAIAVSSEKKSELIKCLKIPLEPDISKESPQFSRFLRSAITDFYGHSSDIEVWSIIPSTHVETRYIRIPKVPSKQIANAVYWTYKKEVNFNDASDIFDFEVLGDIVEDGVRRTEVIAYSVPKQEIQLFRSVFAKSGYPLNGISIVPFALQNLLRSQWVGSDAKNICNLFMGKDWSRIAIFSNGNLILSREIKSGIQSMIEAIRESISGPEDGSVNEAFVDDSGQTTGEPGKGSSYDVEEAQRIFYNLIQERSPAIEASEGISQAEDAFEMIVPALERVVRQVERTIAHYALNFKGEAVSRIIVSGEICTSQPILDYIAKQLEQPVVVIDPFETEASLSEQVEKPESAIESEAYIPAIGIALSNNTLTPNFIHTYKEKEAITTVARFNRVIFGTVFLLIAVCLGAYFWQSRIISLKKIEEAQLQRQLDRYIPYVDSNLIMQMVAQVQQNRATMTQFDRKYQPMALVRIVSNKTPTNIRLLNLRADFAGIPGDKDKKPKRTLVLEGIILGDRLTFESSLAGYIVQLKKSLLFGKAGIQNKTIELFEDKEVMRFSAQLELI